MCGESALSSEDACKHCTKQHDFSAHCPGAHGPFAHDDLFSELRVHADELCATADQLKSLCEFQGDDTFYCLTPQRWLEILTFAQSVSRGSASHIICTGPVLELAPSKQWLCSWSLDTHHHGLL